MADYQGAGDNFNPKEELKKRSATYATYIYHGLATNQRHEFEAVPEEALSAMKAKFAGKSVWEMWGTGKIYQYFILQWASAKGPKPVLAVAKYLVRTSHLVDINDEASKKVVLGLAQDLAASGADQSAVSEVAQAAMEKLHKELNAATSGKPETPGRPAAGGRRSSSFGVFTGGVFPLLQPVLAVAGEAASAKADDFFAGGDYGMHLARAVYHIGKRKKREDFHKSVKPLLIGVGGYGLVTLAFEGEWGSAYALKRQSINMVLDKKHADRAMLELKIASELHSPFLLDCPYAYIDGKDLVLALRMLTGGDLAHYVKMAKEKAKKDKKPKTGLTCKEAQFYLGSTVLALQVLHSHGFVYRDLKDKNVLLDETGRARMCDFGLVHDLNASPCKGKVGTKGFWAPEQLDKHTPYDEMCDIWTLGVCAYHWCTGVVPFYSAEGEETMNEMTKKAEYDKSVSHLVKAPMGAEASLFCPQLKELCEALLVVDPKERLGHKDKGGYPALMAHPFFKGLDWNALSVGTLKPPIDPPRGDINADLPKELKDEFGEWAAKDLPDDAMEIFKDWERVNIPVVENTAVEWLEQNPVFFDGKDKRNEFDYSPDKVKAEALVKSGLWTETIKPPDVKIAAAKSKGGGGGEAAGGGGGGCCAVM